MDPAGGRGWVAVSLLGHDLTGAVDWLDAEEALDSTGLSWLADVWMLEGEGRSRPASGSSRSRRSASSCRLTTSGRSMHL
ncbi:hypothetical protein NKG05_01620 [Oerskovia sp. M15]